VGLGHEFLRHIKRAGALVHIVDASAADPVADFRTLEAELKAYDPDLIAKRSVIIANKMDLPEAAEGLAKLRAEIGGDILPVSAATGKGLKELLKHLKAVVRRDRE
jgi:GTPase